MFTYFLQVNVCWLLFYGVYYAFLSRETFFKLNRIYLIISLLCGLVIPIVVPKMDMPIVQPLVEVVQPITVSVAQMQELLTVQTIETQPTTLGIWTILMKLYSLGVAFFLLKFCLGLVTIFKLNRSGKKVKNSDFSLIYTEEVKTPFSFFNWIFVNQNTVENADFQHIITHEQAHVRQKHSFDILGLEILRGAFWLSPLVHLYARSLRNVHEYLADAAVLQNTQKQSYGRLLINQTAAGSGLVLANHLNFSQLKKRIIMMSRNPSQRVALVKYTFAAPIFLLILALLASPKTKVLATTAKLGETVTNTVDKIGEEISPPTIPNSLTPDTLTTIKHLDNLPANLIVKIENGGAGGLINVGNFIQQNALTVSQFMVEPNVQWLIESFSVQKVSKNGLSSVIKNTGNRFNKDVKALLNQAQAGDLYHFTNIIIRSNSDKRSGNWGNLTFTISDAYQYGIPTLSTGQNDGSISKKLLLTLSESGLQIRGYKKYRVGSFSIKRFPIDKTAASVVKNEGVYFSEEAKNLFKTVETGDVLIFDDIKIYDTEGRAIMMSDKINLRIGDSKMTTFPLSDITINSSSNEKQISKPNIDPNNDLPLLMKTIEDNTRVPQFIFDKKISGQVLVFFDMSEEGDISNMRTASIFTNEKKEPVELDFSACEQEAMRVLRVLPKDLLLARIKYVKDLKEDCCANDSGKYIPVNFPK